MAITMENTGKLRHVSPQRVTDCGDGCGTRLRIGTFGIVRREVIAHPDGRVQVFDIFGSDGNGVLDVTLRENEHMGGYIEVDSPCLIDLAINKLSLGLLATGRIVVRNWGNTLDGVDKIPEWPKTTER